MIGVPRIQGKVGQATEPAEVAGKWFFTIWVTVMGSGESEEFGPYGPWDTEIIAKRELEIACRQISDTIAENIPGGVPGQYLDMKDNKLKKWVPKGH
jgi:hypothetical protein